MLRLDLICISIWMLYMIQSIHSLSPAEKLLASGASSYPSPQNSQDMFLMTSAKALLSEFQSDQDKHQEGEAGSLRKKRSVGITSASAPTVYKRFSGFNLESSPLFSTDISEDTYKLGFSTEAVEVEAKGEVANCLVSNSGLLICGDVKTEIPPGVGKSTRRLVRGSEKLYLVHLDHFDDGDVKLMVTPVVVNDLSVTASLEDTSGLLIPRAFLKYNATLEDPGYAVLSTISVDSGIYITFFSPERDESLTVAFYTFLTGSIEIIEFDLEFATYGIKDVKLVKFGRAIFMIIAREDSSLAIKLTTKGSTTSFKLDAVLDSPGNEVLIHKKPRFGATIVLLDVASYSVYTFKRGSFIKLTKKDASFGNPFRGSAFTENPEQELSLRTVNESTVMVMHFNSFTGVVKDFFPLPAKIYSNLYETVSVVGFGRTKSSLGDEKFQLYAKVYNNKDKTYKLKGYHVNFDTKNAYYSVPTPLEKEVDTFAFQWDEVNPKIENFMTSIELADIILLSEDLNHGNLQVGESKVSGSVSSLKTVSLDIIYNVTDASQVSFANVNYNDEASVISQLIEESTVDISSEDYLFKNSILMNSDQEVTVVAGATITIPNVVTNSAEFSQVATETVSSPTEDVDVADFITKSLRTDGASLKINVPVIFSSSISTSSISFNAGAKPKNDINRVVPSKMFDITKENSIDAGLPMKFKNLKLSAEADLQGGLNGIDLDQVVQTSGDGVTIIGDKSFPEGMTVSGNLVIVEKVNDADVNEIFSRKYIFKEDPNNVDNENYVQTLKTKSFKFNSIKILDHLYVNKMGDSEEFSVDTDKIVVTNQNADISSGKVIFKKDLNLALGAITSAKLNSVPTENNFIHDATQTFSSSIEGIQTLYVKGNLQSGKMNSVDLDADVARINVENTFESEVTFTTLGVTSAITMGSLNTVNGIDLSHTTPIQHYPGTITVTGGSLHIKQNDVKVDLMDFGTITNQPMSKKDFADEFIYTDTNQDLPNLVSVASTTVLDVADLSLRSTLDSLNLATDVMHTSSDAESSSSNVRFTGGVTTFTDGLTITNGGDVGPYSLLDLHKQSYCGHDHHDFKYKGLKTIPKIVSNADVNVLTSFTANARDFGNKDLFNVVKNTEANTFTGKMTFKELETTSDVTLSGSVVDASGSSATPLLNGKNLGIFDANVVRNIQFTETEGDVTKPIITKINSDVTMSVAMDDAAHAVLLTPDGTLNRVNVKNYLDEKVLLDENHPVTVKLNAPDLKFNKGIQMVPTEETKETYFNGQNLETYADNLFKEGDNSLGGKKTITGTLKINGDLNFATDIHPFGIDLPSLKETGFQKSVEQTITQAYEIGDVTEVNKVIVDKIDGIKMNDICFTDETSCTLTCDESLPTCVHFMKNLKASGGINFNTLESIRMSSILDNLDSNANSYNLDLLKITSASGGLDWTNDQDKGAVSGLLKNMVVKSDKDWSSRDESATTAQTVAGDIDLYASVSINDLKVKSGLVNKGTADEVAPVDISIDGALKAGGNQFTGTKTFTKQVKASEATITKMVNLKEINDLDVEDFKNKAVYSESMDDPDFAMTQTITGAWTLSRGINVQGPMVVDGEIDEVAVDDFVQKHLAQFDKNIPKVTFSNGVTVTGDVDATGTAFKSTLDSFMANRIKLSTEDTVQNKLRFSGAVEFKDAIGNLVDITVTSLNNIPAATWALTGSDDLQKVDIKTVFNQDTVIVNGNLVSNDLHGTDLSDKYGDALKINEDAVIAGPGVVTFAEDTVLLGQKLTGTLPPNLNNTLKPLMEDVSKFVGNLHNFYTANIVNVIPKLDQEIRIAKKLDLGMVSYLDEVTHPRYLAIDLDDKKELTFNASQISSLELDENLYSMNYKVDSLCSWKDTCLCQTSVLASPLDSVTRAESQDRIFSFKLDSGTFVLTSNAQSYSDDCVKAGDGNQLIISGVFDNPESVDVSMIVLTPTTIGSALKSEDLNLINPTTASKVGYVKSAVMWEVGTGIYLAVASGFPNKLIAVFRYDRTDPSQGWVRENDLEVGEDLSHLKAFTFSNLTKIHTHLYAVRDLEVSVMWMSDIKEIVVYHQVYTPGEGSLPSLTEVPEIVGAPGLVDYEVFLHEDKTEAAAQVTLLVAQNYKFDLGPDISVVVTLVWDPVYGQFIPAIVPDNVQHIGGQMVKLESASISNHDVLIVAEVTRLSVYRFVPYEGLSLLDQVETGVIADFAVTKKNIRSDTLNIYVIEADKKSRMFRLYTDNTVPTISLKHGYYQ